MSFVFESSGERSESNLVQWKKGKEGYRYTSRKLRRCWGGAVEYLTTGTESKAENLYRAFKNAPENVQNGIRCIWGIWNEK